MCFKKIYVFYEPMCFKKNKKTNMNFELQPTLQDATVRLEPLQADDFEKLYAIACDPSIWEQHPNPDRYKRPIFETFFQGAIASKAAFLIYDQQTNQLIGCTRYYELDDNAKSIAIGYTFLAKSHWGTTYNQAAKKLMFHHAFKYVDKLIFHIGEHNIRSQKAISKLGAVKIDRIEMPYYGEAPKYNFVYQMNKANWT
jgi:RimJ/RimL family protein N-acetyltransferase